jgi:signal transduction histidine kinase
MRLTVQSFNHNFDPHDSDIKSKMNEFSETLIQQIDVMSSIASAFSNFAQMPSPSKERLNIVDEVKKSLDIFHESYISYHPEKMEIITNLDKIQLTRIVTNLITNAIHALENKEDPHIDVRVSESKKKVWIKVQDNGKGIEKRDLAKIFEPKFTTKSSGMGLGLPMVKNIVEAYNGTITVDSGVDKGTIFSVSLPKE